jgi:hypothetical protein
LYAGIMIGLAFAVAFGAVAVFTGRYVSPRARMLLAYAMFNIAWVSGVSNTFTSFGDNMRFRFVTDPFTVAILAIAAQTAFDRLQRNTASVDARTLENGASTN